METNREYLMRTGIENFIYDTDYCKYCYYNQDCRGFQYKSKCIYGIRLWLDADRSE